MSYALKIVLCESSEAVKSWWILSWKDRNVIVHPPSHPLKHTHTHTNFFKRQSLVHTISSSADPQALHRYCSCLCCCLFLFCLFSSVCYMPLTPYSQASYQYHSTKYRERNCYSKNSLSRITIYSRTPAQCFTKQCNKWSLCNLHARYKQGHRPADGRTVCIQFCSPPFLGSFLKILFF